MISAAFSLQNLQEHLRFHAGDYFPGLPVGEWSITLKSSKRRRYSQIVRFAVSSQNASHDLFVKVPRAAPALLREQSGLVKDRPRLLALLSAREEAAREFAGMRKLAAHFQAYGESRLGVARVLDLYDGESIVMEAVDLPILDAVLGRAARWRNQAHNAEIAAAFHAAGVWLRVLHALPADQTNRPRLATRDELLQTIDAFVDYLEARQRSFLPGVRKTLERFICTKLPWELPLVVAHGDFGLHNLFVTEEGGILGFDTLAHWQIPPLIDVAYFLLLLETIPPYFANRTWITGAAVLQICRREFLRGYCGESEEPANLALFEVLVALDKWTSVVHSCRTARGALGALKRWRLQFQEYWLQRRVGWLLERLDQGRDAQREMPALLTARSLL